MNKYYVSLEYSRNGESYHSVSRTIEAESDLSAIEQAKSMFPYQYVKIISVRQR